MKILSKFKHKDKNWYVFGEAKQTSETCLKHVTVIDIHLTKLRVLSQFSHHCFTFLSVTSSDDDLKLGTELRESNSSWPADPTRPTQHQDPIVSGRIRELDLRNASVVFGFVWRRCSYSRRSVRMMQRQNSRHYHLSLSLSPVSHSSLSPHLVSKFYRRRLRGDRLVIDDVSKSRRH